MISRLSQRREVWLLLALVLSLLAACGSDDDAAPTTTREAAASPQATRTAPAASPDAATPAGATSPAGTTASATATVATDATATPTPASTQTPGDTSEATLPDFQTLDPADLPNFTLALHFEAENLGGVEGTTLLNGEVRQHDPDNYYLLFRTEQDGTPSTVEAWKVDGRYWMSQDGEVLELPEGQEFFNPSLFLQQSPELPEQLRASRAGAEEISGRETIRYDVSAEDYARWYGETQPEAGAISNVEGSLRLWYDPELQIMLKAEGDLSWSEAGGTAVRWKYDFEISDIGDTAKVAPPQ